MSVTLLVWLGLFALLVVLSFKRPAYGVSLYMLTFFAFPDFWWWGKHAIGGYRWSLYGGIGLLVAVIVSRLFGHAEQNSAGRPLGRFLGWVIVAILVNATIVHLLLAPNQDISSGAYWLLAKFVLLFFLIAAAVRTPQDLRTILLSIVVGAGYIGYETTINDRGRVRGSRLEGIGAPGATGANQCASLMVTVLPLTGAFFLAGKLWEKLLMLPIAPFILNVIILCNSRGAFLSLIAAVIALVLFSPPRVRKRIAILLGLGAVATLLLLGDPRIVERFMTTFAEKEERGSSAQGRLDYAIAGFHMIIDHPLGAGGNGFKKVHGVRYISEVNGEEFDARAVHNGFINEACEWGLQGFVLRMLFVSGGLWVVLRTSRSPSTSNDPFARLVGITLLTGMVGFLVTCMFGDFLDAEWGYWVIALVVAQARILGVPAHVSQPAWNLSPQFAKFRQSPAPSSN